MRIVKGYVEAFQKACANASSYSARAENTSLLQGEPGDNTAHRNAGHDKLGYSDELSLHRSSHTITGKRDEAGSKHFVQVVSAPEGPEQGQGGSIAKVDHKQTVHTGDLASHDGDRLVEKFKRYDLRVCWNGVPHPRREAHERPGEIQPHDVPIEYRFAGDPVEVLKADHLIEGRKIFRDGRLA